jgi:lipopolysaccharide transport system ATP-binding protein
MSSDIILKVENVSKLYRLGNVGTGTFGGDVQRFWKTKVLGQEDPFLKIGQTNDRTSKEKAEFVWALKDINFEVKRGEVLGIIGKNGAGKSTLLKLLSRITSPTTGSIKSAGRMASLLEVGTGFHPELTGRENIYLNGAVLGMTKKEIQSKFDEIVDFSGCELYIDTPVKRYSSGMMVRLGFAVAAFLDPEILVVDEVLAVGDAEFQKKAIGKMKEVSEGGGRTVLFVSHNMESISKLCTSAIYLYNGSIVSIGGTPKIIDLYLNKNREPQKESIKIFLRNNITVKDLYIKNESSKLLNILNQGENWIVCFSVDMDSVANNWLRCNFELHTSTGIPVTCFGNEFENFEVSISQNKNFVIFDMGTCVFKKGTYFLNAYFQVGDGHTTEYKYLENIIDIVVEGPLKPCEDWDKFIYAPQHGYVAINVKNSRVVNR